MSFMVRLTDAEVASVATEVLSREMAGYPFERAEARSGDDHADIPSIYVTAMIGAGVPPLEGNVMSKFHRALHEALLSRGEERFPYFSLRRADDEPPADNQATDEP